MEPLSINFKTVAARIEVSSTLDLNRTLLVTVLANNMAICKHTILLLIVIIVVVLIVDVIIVVILTISTCDL